MKKAISRLRNIKSGGWYLQYLVRNRIKVLRVFDAFKELYQKRG